jgi:hypothetical protein
VGDGINGKPLSIFYPIDLREPVPNVEGSEKSKANPAA